jgi:hypothetical protein
MRDGTTSRVMAVDRPCDELYDFYSVSPEYFGCTLLCHKLQSVCTKTNLLKPSKSTANRFWCTNSAAAGSWQCCLWNMKFNYLLHNEICYFITKLLTS